MSHKKESKKLQIHHIFRKKHFIVFGFPFFVILTLLFLISTYYYFSSRTLPNVEMGQINLGGLKNEALYDKINPAIEVFQSSSLNFLVEGRSVKINVNELGITFDSEQTAQNVSRAGKQGALASNISSFFRRKNVRPEYNLDVNQFLQTINKNFSSLETMPANASISFANSGPVVVLATPGKVINREYFYGEVRTAIENLDNRNNISLEMVDLPAAIGEDQVVQALDKSNFLFKSQISLAFGQDRWVLSGRNLFDLLKFYPSHVGGDHLASFALGENNLVLDSVSGDTKADFLDVGIDENKVDTYLNSVAKIVDKPKRDATLKFENGQVSEFRSAQDGQTLDREGTKALLIRNLSVTNDKLANIISIQLPVAVVPAEIANTQINSFGIKELVGSGVSYFAGSIPNRVFNVGLGASLINGALVKPGEIFSFDNLVGPVSKDQGFKQAYVINAGHTVLDDGGGICQVSTTVFRAALNSGMPIVKRTAHAYRVGYYEQNGFKAGLDATIFSPSVDLQFKNDTEHYLLVQATVDKLNSRIQVDIYGTRDGRRVQLSEPVVSNVTPAPEPKFQDEPTLPKGVVKQVDFAAAGATSVFTRKVYKENNLIIDDTFKSNYRPWQAVYLRGTAG